MPNSRNRLEENGIYGVNRIGRNVVWKKGTSLGFASAPSYGDAMSCGKTFTLVEPSGKSRNSKRARCLGIFQSKHCCVSLWQARSVTINPKACETHSAAHSSMFAFG